MYWSLGRSSVITILLALICALLYSLTAPKTAFISLNYRHTPGWQFKKDLWNEDLFHQFENYFTNDVPFTNDGWLTRNSDPGRTWNLGDSFEIQIPLRISHLPTDIHNCEELILINAFVWGTTTPVLFNPTLLVTFILRSGICHYPVLSGTFPGSSDDKESARNVGDLGSDPGLGRSPGGGHGNPLQYSCLENSHGQRSLAGYRSWGHKESGNDWALRRVFLVSQILKNTLCEVRMEPGPPTLFR